MKEDNNRNNDLESDNTLRSTTAAGYFSIGTAYLELGLYREAADALETAVRVQSDYFEAYLELGALYEKVCDSGKAIAAYEQALRCQPECERIRLKLKAFTSTPTE